MRTAVQSGMRAGPVPGAEARSATLRDAAESTRRAIDAYAEKERFRSRGLALAAAGGGALAFLFALAAALGWGDPRAVSVLAGLAGLAPTGYAIARGFEREDALSAVGTGRFACDLVAGQARRLGESLADTLNRSLSAAPELLAQGQMDLLFRDLDRTRRALLEAGAEIGLGTPPGPDARLTPDHPDTVLCTADGRRFPVRVLELTPAGATLRGKLPTLLRDDPVTIGGRPARVSRSQPERTVLLLASPIAATEFNRRIVL